MGEAQEGFVYDPWLLLRLLMRISNDVYSQPWNQSNLFLGGNL